MITTGSLANIYHHTVINFFLFVMRSVKIYFLRNFQICNTVLFTIVTMLYINHILRTKLCYNFKFALLTPFTYFAHPCL